jgi:hypothetical protein
MERLGTYSLHDRILGRPRHWWATLLAVLLVYLPSLAAAYALGLTDPFGDPRSRSVLASPTVIAYVLVLGPIMRPLESSVVRSLRPILRLGDDELERIVERASRVPWWQEIAAIGLGLAFGGLIIGLEPWPSNTWPAYVIMATGYAMLGLLAWTGFMSIAGTRVVGTLLRLPLRVDPLDRKPFEAIGRQSLAMALAFVGGITIALVLGGYGSAVLMEPRFWLLFLPLSVLPVVVFYLNMRPTHRLLSAARDQALDNVQKELRRAYPSLLERAQRGEAAERLPSEIAALASYEKALQDAATWPYNPATLRTLVVSVLIPTATLLARRVFEVYIR